MENLSIAPRVKYFTVTVEVPINKLILISERFDVIELEKQFFRIYAKEQEPEAKKNYRRCYIIFKLAHMYYGGLKTYANVACGIQFTIAFKTLDQLSNFLEDLNKSFKNIPVQ